MAKELWINLPVKDINRSKQFFAAVGFEFNGQYGNSDNSACLLLGDKKTVVMLFEEAAFKGFTRSGIPDTTDTAEVLLSLSMDSVAEVDAIIQKAVAAGGSSSHQPGEMKGWLYGAMFADPDGHRWNVLYMDMSRMAAK